MDGVTITIGGTALVGIGIALSKIIDAAMRSRKNGNGYVRDEECNRITTRIYDKLDTISNNITDTKVDISEIKATLRQYNP